MAPTQFFWFFMLVIGGIMLGAWTSGRQAAGKVAPKRQIRDGFLIMTLTSLANVAINFATSPGTVLALIPIAVFVFGWALMVPAVTLLVLDLHPTRRGMASSLQAVIASTANGVVAGAIAPLVMHSAPALAITSALMLCIGLAAWLFLHRHWPEIGRMIEEA